MAIHFQKEKGITIWVQDAKNDYLAGSLRYMHIKLYHVHFKRSPCSSLSIIRHVYYRRSKGYTKLASKTTTHMSTLHIHSISIASPSNANSSLNCVRAYLQNLALLNQAYPQDQQTKPTSVLQSILTKEYTAWFHEPSNPALLPKACRNPSTFDANSCLRLNHKVLG